jgi:hypothetical protein
MEGEIGIKGKKRYAHLFNDALVLSRINRHSKTLTAFRMIQMKFAIILDNTDEGNFIVDLPTISTLSQTFLTHFFLVFR